jgi:cell division protein FtsB
MAPAKKASAGGGQRRVKQFFIAAGVVSAIVFAVQGGEYGTRDLMRQKHRRIALKAAIDSLQRTVDSLKRYKRRVETDPVLQERIAREEFGMVRGNKEILYRFAEPEPAP